MASNTATSFPSQSNDLPFPEYFSALAANYARQTGNSTNRLFALSFDDLRTVKPINEHSRVHDNAAGPGTATSVIVDKISSERLPEILITDNVPAMVQAAKDTFAAFPKVEARMVDSLNLEGIPNNHFTHSILNFSIFTFADPLKGLQEIYRTLKPGGLAALVTWKRFGAGRVVHAAQALIRPDLPPMKIPHPEFMDQGVLEKFAVDAGFTQTKLVVSQKTIALEGSELEHGLREFLIGDFTRPARVGWTDEEKGKWNDAVDEAIKKEVDTYGGVKFDSWVVLATK